MPNLLRYEILFLQLAEEFNRIGDYENYVEYMEEALRVRGERVRLEAKNTKVASA
ncbi:hypothetical protein ACJ2A9_21490 [Anaerobacillus sp. MEB173]|uniref:hypothetical protein n=1 Tax=Anaerobacillus sp. MEB173 TaxID=3383345 RepID=UPI003F900294